MSELLKLKNNLWDEKESQEELETVQRLQKNIKETSK